MNILNRRKAIGILMILSMVLSMISSVFAEGLIISPEKETYMSGEEITVNAFVYDGDNKVTSGINWYYNDENGDSHDILGESDSISLSVPENNSTQTITNTVYAEYGDEKQWASIDIETTALAIESMTPESEGSLGGTTGEISITFNQEVEINDVTPQIGLYYDSDGDGEIIDDSKGVGTGTYDDVLEIDENKVILKINSLLEENHVYEIIMNTSIKASSSGEEFEGLGLDGSHSWVFDTNTIIGELTPADGGSLEETTGEISITFNQEVEINDLTPQIALYYDEDSDGEVVNTSTLVGTYDNVLEVSESDTKKVIVKINDLLTEEHVYKLIVYPAIQTTENKEAIEEFEWTFYTKAVNELTEMNVELDFARRESPAVGSQDFLGASMNNGIIYAVRGEAKFPELARKGTRIYAFDLYGHELWNTRIDKAYESKSTTYMPVYDEAGNVYIQTRISDSEENIYTTQLYAIDPDDGSIKWKREIEEEDKKSKTCPIIIDDQIIIGAGEEVYSFKLEDGEDNWHYSIDDNGLSGDIDDYKIGSPLTKDDDGNIYVTVVGNNTGITDSKIQVLDTSGKEKWSYTAGEKGQAVISSYGRVYVTDYEGVIHTLNPDDGSIVSEDSLNGYFIKSDNDYDVKNFDIGKDDTIYAYVWSSVSDPKIIAINLDGTIKYTYTNGKDVNPLQAIDDEGYIYYNRNIDNGFSLFAVAPTGNVADQIIPSVSTMPAYVSLYIDGSVLIAAKSYSTNVVGIKLERKTPEQPASIEIVEKNKQFGVNMEEVLGVVVRNEAGKAMLGKELEWTSSDPSIVEATEDGTFICHKKGNATLTVNIKGTDISDSTTVEVIEKAPTPTSIEILDKNGEVITDELIIEYEKSYQFKVVVYDQYGDVMDDEEVVWYSIINSFPTIDGDGVLNAKALGSYTLEVISRTDVTVTDEVSYKIEKMEGKYSNIIPKEGAMTLNSTISFTPADQYDQAMELQSIEWSSSDEAVAKVDSEGEVTAVGYGTATITGKSGDISQSREASVIPSFGYEWNKKDNRTSRYIAQADDGTIYYSEKNDDSNYDLISLNSDGEENWRIEIGTATPYIEVGQDGNIYCLTYNEDGDRVLASINFDKSINWEKNIGSSGDIVNNIEIVNETIYVALVDSQASTLYAIDSEGNKKWYMVFDGELKSFTSDNEGNIICTTIYGGDSRVNIIKDEASKGTVTEYVFEDVRFGYGNIEVDSQGVIYGYFEDTVGLGVCAIKNGQIIWKSYGDENAKDYANIEKIVLSDEGNLYFIIRYNYWASINDNGNYILYALDTQGNRLWEKELFDLRDIDHFILPEGNFVVDSEDNLYLPYGEDDASDSSATYTKSHVVKINSDGEVVQAIGYDSDKYGYFKNIYLSMENDGLYVWGEGAKKQDIDYCLVKLSFDNDQELVIDEIKVSAYKNSVIIGDTLQLKAQVMDQLGGVMADEAVTWSSSDDSIISVDANGLVKGLKAGEVDIKATAVNDSNVTATIHITAIEAGEHHVSTDTINEKTQAVIEYYKEKGMPTSDWVAFGLSALGEDINSAPYLSNGKGYIYSLRNSISASKGSGLITEYERMTIGILAGGYDPHNFGGMNLIEKIYTYGSLSQGNNAAAFALIALDAANAKVPEEDSYFTQEFLIDHLLKNKAGDGWAISGSSPDTDVTAMALYALAPYKDREDVSQSIDEAVEWLKSVQNENGSFNCYGEGQTNTESTAQVIIALTALGIDPQGDEYVRADGNPVSALFDNQLSDGSFEHEKGNGSDSIATEQTIQALAALKDFYENGKCSIFYHMSYQDMTEPTISTNLKDKVADDITLSFTVEVTDNVDEEVIPVVKLNGSKVTGDNGSYTVTLNEGENIIIIDATDASGNEAKESYIIAFVSPFKLGEEIEIEQNETLYFEGGIKIDLGNAVVGNDARIKITDVSSDEQYIPSEEVGLEVAGKILKIELTGVEVDEDDPVTLTLPVTEEDNIDKASIYYFDEETNGWEYQECNRKDGNLIFEAEHFSVYGALEDDTPPYNVKVESKIVSSDRAMLKFSAQDTSGIEEYWIYRDDFEDEPIETSQENTFTDEDLRADTTYEYRIKAVDALGNISDFSEILEITTAEDTDTGEPIPEKDSKKVYIRVEGYEHTVVSRTRITVPVFGLDDYLGEADGSSATESSGWGEDKFDSPTNAHAIVKALEDEGVKYDFQDYGWSLYMAMIDGDREFDHGGVSGWMYRVNDKMPSVGSNERVLKDGDEIVWYYGAYGYDNLYTKITADDTSIPVGVEVKIHVDGYRGSTKKDLEGATILVDGEPYEIDGEEVETDEEGDATLEFEEEGRYEISLIRYKKNEGKYIDIVRPDPITIKVAQGESSDTKETIENSDYEEEYKIISDEDAKESEVVEALNNVINKLSKKINKIKTEEDAKGILSDAKDVSKIIKKAADRVSTEEGAKEVVKESIKAVDLLAKSAEKLVKDEDKKKLSKTAAGTMETILKVIDKITDTEEINKLAGDMIEALAGLMEKLGDENAEEIKQKAIEAAEKAVEKGNVKEIEKDQLKVEKDRIVAAVDKNIINKIAENASATIKLIKEKLQKNGFEAVMEIENKVTIQIPQQGKEEIETKLLSGTMKALKENGIEKAVIETEIAQFKITPKTFGERAEGKEISLSVKKIDKNTLSQVQQQQIPEGSPILDLNAMIGGEKVSSFEEPIEISISYEEVVEEGKTVKIFFLGDDGTIEPMEGEYDSITKTVTFTTSHFSKYFAKEVDIEEVDKTTFKDLEGYEWAKDAVEAMTNKGIVNGREEGIFEPDANITRAEFATLVAKMMGYANESIDIPFTDVAKDAWYYDYVGAAYKNGLINGRNEAVFEPNGNITRQEMAVIVAKVLKQKGYEEESLDELNTFEDEEAIGNWAKSSVGLCSKANIINGMENGAFAPKENANRAQAVVILYRLYQLIK